MDADDIPELGRYADLFKDDDTLKPVRLSLHLIAKRNLPPEAKEWSHDEMLEALNKISHLRLDRENIRQIDGLELLGDSVRNIYLQQNQIEVIENLECLKNLQFITLAGNSISNVQNLSHLQKLFFLDLSDNLINNFDIDEFPQSLLILNLKGNPCTNHPDHRGRIIQDLPKLQQLDEVEVSCEEKLEAGFKVSSDEEDDEKEEEKNINASTNIQSVTSKILLRSQQRLERDLYSHKKHFDQLEEIREKSHLRTARSQRTPRSSEQSLKSRMSEPGLKPD